MTLAESVERLRNRVKVDLEAEVDIDDNEVAADEIVTAAIEFSRDAYCFFERRSSLTLAVNTGSDTGKFNLLTACEHRMFDLRSANGYAVHINGSFLREMTPSDFEECYQDYYNLGTTANPSHWSYSGPNEIVLGNPPNATAVAASDNYVSGFREHGVYTYNLNKDDELQGDRRWHRLIVIKAALNISEGFVSSEQGFKRRGSFQKTYNLAVFGGVDSSSGTVFTGMRNENLERVRPLERKLVAGTRRRIFGIGSSR